LVERDVKVNGDTMKSIECRKISIDGNRVSVVLRNANYKWEICKIDEFFLAT